MSRRTFRACALSLVVALPGCIVGPKLDSAPSRITICRESQGTVSAELVRVDGGATTSTAYEVNLLAPSRIPLTVFRADKMATPPKIRWIDSSTLGITYTQARVFVALPSVQVGRGRLRTIVIRYRRTR